MAKHLKIKIYGQVQGVLFRYTAKEKADELAIYGFARNEDDGTVYIEAEGEEDALEIFLDWCNAGPFSAKVVKVERTEGEVKNFSDFKNAY